MISNTLTHPEQLARERVIIEVESWFTVLLTKATDLRCRVQLENRIQKSAYIYRAFDGFKLGRIWVNYSGVICYEPNHLSVSRNATYQACHLSQALIQIISYHF
ncbi:hypothetical protein [Chroococcus sp. FPU101]|uniref:hypothetical protein n=1 Tax=Chroococcus sp. FPU101 TaxID=1974212 RepID=UPI001A8DD9E7|nr:hypothetical protein [Chroococcus sp. FPU101]GFE70040.1 hypothetical protein CFPU101_26500 [Chroococcus sp. FPU101]